MSMIEGLVKGYEQSLLKKVAGDVPIVKAEIAALLKDAEDFCTHITPAEEMSALKLIFPARTEAQL